MTKWAYNVIHITEQSAAPEEKPDPQKASEKLKGGLSPEFIAREFPKQYGEQQVAKTGKHPAQQLSEFLNQQGQNGWELETVQEITGMKMFIFKKPAASKGDP
jgi:hypothetical protein